MVYARLAPEPSTGGVICGEESANTVGEITVQALRGGPVRLDGPESLLLRCITAAS
jgi:hypothetical protein